MQPPVLVCTWSKIERGRSTRHGLGGSGHELPGSGDTNEQLNLNLPIDMNCNGCFVQLLRRVHVFGSFFWIAFSSGGCFSGVEVWAGQKDWEQTRLTETELFLVVDNFFSNSSPWMSCPLVLRRSRLKTVWNYCSVHSTCVEIEMRLFQQTQQAFLVN